MKNTVIGFVGALVVVASVFYGPKVWHFAKAVHQLSQIIAIDQKSGQQYSVADVLTEMAAERVQLKIQQQQEQPKKP